MNKAVLVLPVVALLLGSAVSASSSGRELRASREDARLEKALAGKVPGKPVDCIDLRYAHGTEGFDNAKGTLLFKVSRKLVYRTDTHGLCRNIGSGNALITHVFSGDRLCRGDIAQSADLVSGFESGSCAMGDFTPYTGS